jgi:hypothetical protein
MRTLRIAADGVLAGRTGYAKVLGDLQGASFIPGVVTPSEAMAALDAGVRAVAEERATVGAAEAR